MYLLLLLVFFPICMGLYRATAVWQGLTPYLAPNPHVTMTKQNRFSIKDGVIKRWPPTWLFWLIRCLVSFWESFVFCLFEGRLSFIRMSLVFCLLSNVFCHFEGRLSGAANPGYDIYLGQRDVETRGSPNHGYDIYLGQSTPLRVEAKRLSLRPSLRLSVQISSSVRPSDQETLWDDV